MEDTKIKHKIVMNFDNTDSSCAPTVVIAVEAATKKT